MSQRCALCRSRAVAHFLLERCPLSPVGETPPHRQRLPLCVLHRDLLAAAGAAGRTDPQHGERWRLVPQGT
jgi:hypothetical protein